MPGEEQSVSNAGGIASKGAATVVLAGSEMYYEHIKEYELQHHAALRCKWRTGSFAISSSMDECIVEY